MAHIEQSIKDFDLEKYLNESNDINILVAASYYHDTGVGKYRCLLVYKQHRKYIVGSVGDAVSPNKTMIKGLIDAVNQIKIHNVNVCIISGIYVGFKAAKKNKGVHSVEVNRLIGIVERQNNTISSIAILDGMEAIKRIIAKNAKT
jgi:hypothetical protein